LKFFVYKSTAEKPEIDGFPAVTVTVVAARCVSGRQTEA